MVKRMGLNESVGTLRWWSGVDCNSILFTLLCLVEVYIITNNDYGEKLYIIFCNRAV